MNQIIMWIMAVGAVLGGDRHFQRGLVPAAEGSVVEDGVEELTCSGPAHPVRLVG